MCSQIYVPVNGTMTKISRALFILRFVANYLLCFLKQFLYRIISCKKMAVTIEQGTLIGLQYKTQYSNKPYFSFLGVPYAKPPINDLRFMPPVEHPGWTGELKAYSEGNSCMQLMYPIIPGYVWSSLVLGSEDCLYLNLFVPKEEFNDNKAVMVFIHAGGFNVGSTFMLELSPDYLIENNVIVVTFNYRLNVFGFLNFDIDECPGNMGLKDQRLALNWIKENISAFGGDAGNITIFGVSAGSASVHCHILSPQSKGLFQKAIMQSGSMFNSWAMNVKHKEAAFKLAKLLKCEKDDPRDIVRYFKSLPATDLVKYSYLGDDVDFLNCPFVPSIECDSISNPFVSAHPKVLIKTASPVPVISGSCDMEGMFAITEDRMQRIGDFRTIEAISSFLKGRYSDEKVTKIRNFYFNDRNLECEITRQKNLIQMYGDLYFYKDFYHSIEHLLKQHVTPVYNYEFKFDGKCNILKNVVLLNTQQSKRVPLKGACHGDDINYLFYMPVLLFAPEANSPELKMCRMMCKLWSNFAKTGNPNSSDLSFEWKHTSSDDPKYLAIDGDNTKMVDGLLFGSGIKLWEDIESVRTE